jgi:endoglucanase
MNRVETIVDWGLKRGFYIVLNAHHEGWLKNPSACVNG